MLRLRRELNWREIDDEIVVLDERAGDYLAVNGTGAALWPALVAGTTRERLVEILRERYGLDEERARADADAFVALLASRELLA